MPEAEREVRFKIFQAVLPEFVRSDIGAFCLWALCGFWDGPKKISYNSEPDPDDIVGGADHSVDAFGAVRVNSLDAGLNIKSKMTGISRLTSAKSSLILQYQKININHSLRHLPSFGNVLVTVA